MPLIACPDCGAQVPADAVVCPQCGFPLRREALERAAARHDRFGAASSSNHRTTLIVGVVLVGGLFMVVVIGILAAIAIPRFTLAARRAKEQEGEGLLKQAYTTEMAYYADHGTYARTFEELKTAGWAEPPAPRYYSVEIASADSTDFCLHALPLPGAEVKPIRVGITGAMEHGARCGEYGGDSTTVAEEATQVLRDVYGGVRSWWYEHKRPPASEDELVEAYPSLKTDPDFAIGLTPVGSGGMCVHIAPRATPPAPVVLSMDSGGNLYAGDGCSGSPVDRVWR
ncbi:MAG: zinc-ribbon domain-containing protein [Longimicrobiaceae bacterium]